MKRVIIHWTAGANQPNNTDYQHYHYLINSDGVLVGGKWNVSDNEVCRADAKGNALYAAHCGGGNTGSIGIAVCGMANFNGKPESTKYPLTAVQCEKLFKTVASLCKSYNIPITPQTVMTHYEFGKTHPNTSSHGKIDIIYLHPYNYLRADEIGNFIRNKVRWYYQYSF